MGNGSQKESIWAGFKKFIARGNVMDLAVGVIIGAAFKAIVDSLVGDLLMPLIGIFAGKDTFASLTFTVGGAVFQFGNFISAILNFFIMALVMFLIVRALGSVKEKFAKQQPEAPAAPPAPSKEELLLTEIRDLLKDKK